MDFQGLQLRGHAASCARMMQRHIAGTSRYMEQGREIGGHWIPKGYSCVVTLQVVHRNPAVFPKPDVFQPDRWLPAGEH